MKTANHCQKLLLDKRPSDLGYIYESATPMRMWWLRCCVPTATNGAKMPMSRDGELLILPVYMAGMI